MVLLHVRRHTARIIENAPRPWDYVFHGKPQSPVLTDENRHGITLCITNGWPLSHLTIRFQTEFPRKSGALAGIECRAYHVDVKQ
jgi:hypothetical protein